MKQWALNLWLYLTGLGKLGQLTYKPGWNRWTFLLPYSTTYALGTIWGIYGISSLSRIWYERSFDAEHRFSRWITRKLDDLFPGPFHGARTGPAFLFGSRAAWND